MRITINLLKSRLSDFFLNVSASYFIAAFLTPGLTHNTYIEQAIVFIYYLLIAILYFGLSVFYTAQYVRF